MSYHTLVIIAFAGNICAGMLAVWLTYAGMERSIPAGACTAVTTGSVVLLVERHLGHRLDQAAVSWSVLEQTAIAAILGAIVGVALAIIIWRPELQPDGTSTGDINSQDNRN